MTTYTYTLTFRLNGFHRMERCGNEEQMFTSALELDRLGAEMISAKREVWETKNDYHHLVRIESYSMGKPTHIIWEDSQ